VPEETAVAFTYNGTSHAVMMATPLDLEDFAVGFSLTEGVIGHHGEVESIEPVELEDGIELRLWIDEGRMNRLREKRRYMAGPTGCGLCGVESLAEAMRPVSKVDADATFRSGSVLKAMKAVESAQALNIETRAVHAAGLWHLDDGLIALREDVGRHNAMDKLVGAVCRGSLPIAGSLVILSSRVSVEMVQKVATLGASVIVAVSAPTALAIRTAERAGITLAGVARDDGFEVFTHAHRIRLDEEIHVL